MKYNLINRFLHRLIFINWSILSLVVLSFLTSCTMPQSIDGKNNNHKKLQNYKVNNELTNTANFKEDFNQNSDDSILVSSDENRSIDASASEMRLPTLREQMKVLSDRQDDIESKIDALTHQVNQLTNEIHNLKGIQSNTISTNTIIAGEGENKFESNSLTLLSDEADMLKKEQKIITNKSSNNYRKSSINNKSKRQSAKKSNQTAIQSEESSSSKEPIASALYNAEILINKSDFAEAEKILLEQLDKAPQKAISGKIKLKLAECYIGNGDSQKAREIYEELLTTYPKSELTPIAKKMLQQL